MKELKETIQGIKQGQRLDSPDLLKKEEQLALQVPGFKEVRNSSMNVNEEDASPSRSPTNKINQFSNNFNW